MSKVPKRLYDTRITENHIKYKAILREIIGIGHCGSHLKSQLLERRR
jgi:hypothetical protein